MLSRRGLEMAVERNHFDWHRRTEQKDRPSDRGVDIFCSLSKLADDNSRLILTCRVHVLLQDCKAAYQLFESLY